MYLCTCVLGAAAARPRVDMFGGLGCAPDARMRRAAVALGLGGTTTLRILQTPRLRSLETLVVEDSCRVSICFGLRPCVEPPSFVYILRNANCLQPYTVHNVYLRVLRA